MKIITWKKGDWSDLKKYKKRSLTSKNIDNTIVAYTIIGGATNVKKNFFLHETI